MWHKMFVKGAKLRRNESPGFDSDEHQNVFITSLAKILTSNVLVIIALSEKAWNFFFLKDCDWLKWDFR